MKKIFSLLCIILIILNLYISVSNAESYNTIIKDTIKTVDEDDKESIDKVGIDEFDNDKKMLGEEDKSNVDEEILKDADNVIDNKVQDEKRDECKDKTKADNEIQDVEKNNDDVKVNQKDENEKIDVRSKSNSINATIKASGEETGSIIANGEYEIRSRINNNVIFDIDGGKNEDGAKLQMWDDCDVTQQRFIIERIGDGLYTIKVKKSNKYLEVSSTNKEPGVGVIQNSSNNSDTQKWIIKDVGNGYYSILSKYSGYYITSVGDNAICGTEVKLYEQNNSNTQIFKLDKIITYDRVKTVEDGEYEIRSKINTTKIFDISGGSLDNGAKLQLWDDCDVEQQRFYISYLKDGMYKIQVRKSGKVLDVNGAGKNQGVDVQQYSNNDTDAQKWYIVDAGNGYYSIISKCNDYFMTVSDNIANCGSKIEMYALSGLDNQRFKLDKVMKDVGSQSIEDGEYEIKSKIKESRVFDISGASVEDGAKLQLWDDCDVSQQRFNIKYLGDGTYKIEIKKTQKVLDVEGASITQGVSVQQYTSNDTNAQKWIIKDVGDGYYSIISKCNGYYMTCTDEYANCGSAIKMYTQNSRDSQKFKLEKIVIENESRPIEDGEYEIRAKKYESGIFDISGGSNDDCAKLQIWDDCDVEQQRFYVRYIGDGFYRISVRKSGKVLDVPGASRDRGIGVQQYTSNGTDAQKWIIKDLGNGYCNIISKCSGLYVTTADSNARCGTQIVMNEKNNEGSQLFKFDKVIKDVGVRTVEDGEYEIRSKINNSKIFDINAGSMYDQAKLQLWDDCNVKQQRYLVKYIGDGFYKITVKKSAKVLDVPGAGINQGINVQQYSNNDTAAQKWIIKDTGDGYYNIISVCNGYSMTVSSTSAACGSEIRLYAKQNSDAQKFKLEKISDKIGIDVSSHNGKINWKSVRDSGIEFAMIRVGYRGYEKGTIVTDSCFEYNIKNALANNIEVGVYFYSQAINLSEAMEEAKFCMSKVNGYNVTLPIVFDSEFVTDARPGRADWLQKSERTAICKVFCETVRNGGYEPMIYASKYWFVEELNINEIKSYKLWVAHYTYDVNKKTDFKYDYDIWQYTNKGKVSGTASEYVDCNVWYAK